MFTVALFLITLNVAVDVLNMYFASPAYIAVTVLFPAFNPVMSNIALPLFALAFNFCPSISIVTLFSMSSGTLTITLTVFPTAESFTSIVIAGYDFVAMNVAYTVLLAYLASLKVAFMTYNPSLNTV